MEEPALSWREAGLRYHRLSHYLRRTFGGPTWKVSVDARFGCPNADGTLGRGGCVFCNVRSFSPSRRRDVASVTDQLAEGTRRLRHQRGIGRFLAYFQPGTNTYAPVEGLRSLFEEALRFPGIVGLAVGTRPDCVPDDVLDLLAELSQHTWVSIEYGLQTVHDRSLDWLHRGHHHDAFLDAVGRSRQRGLRVGAHVILGIPGEGRDDMLATAREVGRLKLDSVKLHNLYAVKDTPLAEAVARGEVRLVERDAYVSLAVDFLERLPAECVIDRLCGDAPPEFLVAPPWCLDKQTVPSLVVAEFQRRGTWQGQRVEGPERRVES